jgi:hypothetical protein
MSKLSNLVYNKDDFSVFKDRPDTYTIYKEFDAESFLVAMLYCPSMPDVAYDHAVKLCDLLVQSQGQEIHPGD